jgi:excisionase family DNA binding protein
VTTSTTDAANRPRPVRVLLRVEEAAEMLSIGRCRIFDLINSGELVSVKIGSSRRIPEQAVREYVARLLDGSG